MRALSVLVILLALVCGGGYWNYQRNVHLDADLQLRTFKSYSKDQIDQMIQAHREEAVRLRGEAGQAPELSTRGIDESDLQGKIAAFDRFQRVHNAWEQRYGRAIESQTYIDALEKELAIREAGLDKEWRRILRRATTF